LEKQSTFGLVAHNEEMHESQIPAENPDNHREKWHQFDNKKKKSMRTQLDPLKRDDGLEPLRGQNESPKEEEKEWGWVSHNKNPVKSPLKFEEDSNSSKKQDSERDRKHPSLDAATPIFSKPPLFENKKISDSFYTPKPPIESQNPPIDSPYTFEAKDGPKSENYSVFEESAKNTGPEPATIPHKDFFEEAQNDSDFDEENSERKGIEPEEKKEEVSGRNEAYGYKSWANEERTLLEDQTQKQIENNAFRDPEPQGWDDDREAGGNDKESSVSDFDEI
jgi:hypothetical protein